MKIERIDWREALDIRHRVLWPHKAIEFCHVQGDEHARHYGVYCESLLVGVASAFGAAGSVQLRKFAVDEAYQRQGFGRALLKRLMALEREAGCVVFWCDARENAVGFYEGFVMRVEGERFYKSSQPYFKMSINLQA